MWKQYKKSFLLTQVFIFILVLAVYFTSERRWFLAMLMLIFMQASALIGAASAARQLKKQQRDTPHMRLKTDD